MKKNLLSSIAAFLITLQVNAQTLLTEGFESGSFPPTGWTRINAGTGNNWSRSDGVFTDGPYAANSGTNAMVYEYSTPSAANTWMITPGQAMVTSKTYTISFYYSARLASYPEKMKVTVGLAPTVAAQTTIKWDNNGGTQLTNTSYVLGSFDFTPPANGNYYFGFNCYSNADQWALMVDDITIQVKPTAPPVCTTIITPANLATNQNLATVNLSWNPAANATGYDLYASLSDPSASTTPSLSTGATSALFVNFPVNTLVYWQVRPNNAAGIAAGCPVSTFTTGTDIANNECTGAENISDQLIHNGNTVMSNQSTQTVVCGGYANGDVWYKFTANNNGDATILVTPTGTTSADFDAVIQVLSGSCAALTSFGCKDVTAGGVSETYALTGLTAGTTYYVRVYSYLITDEGPFTIQVTGSALPISLSDFTGTRIDKINRLSWKTQNESNNAGFDIERSADGRNFSSLGFVASKAPGGNSASVLEYRFDDVKSLSGSNYYRLKQNDKDGKFNYSPVVLLKGLKPVSLTLSNVYPNPAVDKIIAAVESPVTGKVTLVITDMAGKVIGQKAAVLNVGDNLLDMNVAQLPSGSYLVKVICDNGCETSVRKFSKQ